VHFADLIQPDPRQVDLALAFASQAAVAIENVRLYERAQALAALEERQRLARDLHDAVSQTFFSASLIAEVLPAVGAESGRRTTLAGRAAPVDPWCAGRDAHPALLELRPAALLELNLTDPASPVGRGITGRWRLSTTCPLEQAMPTAAESRSICTRIAQEALATRQALRAPAMPRLACGVALRPRHRDHNLLELSIADDGCGL